MYRACTSSVGAVQGKPFTHYLPRTFMCLGKGYETIYTYTGLKQPFMNNRAHHATAHMAIVALAPVWMAIQPRLSSHLT